jgi:hypothetical protein
MGPNDSMMTILYVWVDTVLAWILRKLQQMNLVEDIIILVIKMKLVQNIFQLVLKFRSSSSFFVYNYIVSAFIALSIVIE